MPLAFAVSCLPYHPEGGCILSPTSEFILHNIKTDKTVSALYSSSLGTRPIQYINNYRWEILITKLKYAGRQEEYEENSIKCNNF
jgi:hypothetical protein